MGSTRATLPIPIEPVLSPARLLAGPRRAPLPFPFNSPGVQYTYLARNAIYWLAQHWKLRGEEVLFPTFFNGAELEALLAAGVKIRFFPVRRGIRVHAQDIAARITPQTRVVFLIHYSGFPGPVEEVAALCRERGLRLIEDCALAFLCSHGDRPLGTFGDAAVFCLHKPLPVPDGGALVLREGLSSGVVAGSTPSYASVAGYLLRDLITHFEMRGMTWPLRAARFLRRLGKSFTGAAGVERVAVGTASFNPASVDLGISQLSLRLLQTFDYAEIFERRRHNFQYLAQRLAGMVQPVFGELPPGVCPLNFPIYVEDRAALTDALLRRGIEAVPLWARPHPLLPEGSDPVADELRRSVLKLPCHHDLTEQGLDHVAACVESSLTVHTPVAS